MGVIHLTAENFDKEVTKSAIPVIVDFWAEWCGPCRMMGPVFEKLSNNYAGKLKFAKLNVEENGEVAGKYGIQGIPCLIFMKHGVEVDRIVGFAQEPALKKMIDDKLKAISK